MGEGWISSLDKGIETKRKEDRDGKMEGMQLRGAARREKESNQITRSRRKRKKKAGFRVKIKETKQRKGESEIKEWK